jgi:hypothetical protein
MRRVGQQSQAVGIEAGQSLQEDESQGNSEREGEARDGMLDGILGRGGSVISMHGCIIPKELVTNIQV